MKLIFNASLVALLLCGCAVRPVSPVAVSTVAVSTVAVSTVAVSPVAVSPATRLVRDGSGAWHVVPIEKREASPLPCL